MTTLMIFAFALLVDIVAGGRVEMEHFQMPIIAVGVVTVLCLVAVSLLASHRKEVCGAAIEAEVRRLKLKEQHKKTLKEQAAQQSEVASPTHVEVSVET